MKKVMLIFMVICTISLLMSIDTPKKATKLPLDLLRTPQQTRDVPDYTFITNPLQLMFSYCDFFPGGYNSLPMRKQPSLPGMYLLYQAQETTLTSSRMIYYNYLMSDDYTNSGRITTDALSQSFSGFDMDIVINSPFVAWHGDMAMGTKLDVGLAYDQYYLFNTPNMWSSYNLVINNGHGPDEFIYPEVKFGPSPLGTEYRRLYILGRNNTPGAAGTQSQNVKLAYTDFTTEMMDGTGYFDWTITTIPQMDAWHNDIAQHSPHYSFFAGSDGEVGFIGYLEMDSILISEPDLFVLYNTNYGEGDFILDIQNSEQYVDNPLDFFPDSTLYFSPINSSHFNSVYDPETQKVTMINCWGLQSPTNYYPDLQCVKTVSYDLNTNNFQVTDLWPRGADPNDSDPYLPWDLDEDGVIDSINSGGLGFIASTFPHYWWKAEQSAQENNLRITKSKTQPWMAAVWQESTKSRMFNEYENETYTAWENAPEIMISVSENGLYWRDPIVLNKFIPEFADMVPEYVYPADDILDLGNERGLLYLTFYNDLSYGSSELGNGNDIGGHVYVVGLDIDFNEDPVSHSFPFTQGWNSFTYPITTTNHTIGHILGPLGNNLKMVKSPAGIYIPESPINTLVNIVPGSGYYVKVGYSQTFNTFGEYLDLTLPINLLTGWNLVGYLPQTQISVESALATIYTSVLEVRGTEGVYIPGNPNNTLLILSPNKAYWIKMDAPGMLIYPLNSAREQSTNMLSPATQYGQPVIYPGSQVIMADAESAEAGDILLAFSGNELRGQSTFRDTEGMIRTMIQIFGDNSGEQIFFRMLRPSTNEVWKFSNSLSYEPFTTLGDYQTNTYYHLADPVSNSLGNNIPDFTELKKAYPNPFNPSTTLEFSLAQAVKTTIEIFNSKGQLVKTVVKAELNAGKHHIVWNGTDAQNKAVTSGIYFCKFSAANKTQTLKLLLLK